jgi:hypothetical protein
MPHHPSMRRRLIAILPLPLAIAHLGAGVARADEVDAPPRWTASFGVTATRIHSDQPDGAGYVTGRGTGLRADLAYFPLDQLGIAVEAWTFWSDPDWSHCLADSLCYTEVVKEQRYLTAGPRWRPLPSLHLQVTGGVATYGRENEDRAVGPAVTASAGWRYAFDNLFLGVEGRASRMRSDAVDVDSLGLAVTAGATW